MTNTLPVLVSGTSWHYRLIEADMQDFERAGDTLNRCQYWQNVLYAAYEQILVRLDKPWLTRVFWWTVALTILTSIIWGTTMMAADVVKNGSPFTEKEISHFGGLMGSIVLGIFLVAFSVISGLYATMVIGEGEMLATLREGGWRKRLLLIFGLLPSCVLIAFFFLSTWTFWDVPRGLYRWAQGYSWVNHAKKQHLQFFQLLVGAVKDWHQGVCRPIKVV